MPCLYAAPGLVAASFMCLHLLCIVLRRCMLASVTDANTTAATARSAAAPRLATERLPTCTTLSTVVLWLLQGMPHLAVGALAQWVDKLVTNRGRGGWQRLRQGQKWCILRSVRAMRDACVMQVMEGHAWIGEGIIN